MREVTVTRNGKRVCDRPVLQSLPHATARWACCELACPQLYDAQVQFMQVRGEVLLYPA